MTEPAAKFSAKVRVVGKAAAVGDLADGLVCVQHRPADQETSGVIQADGFYEMTAGGVPRRKELLKVA
jgi:hypothetical protein